MDSYQLKVALKIFKHLNKFDQVHLITLLGVKDPEMLDNFDKLNNSINKWNSNALIFSVFF